MKQWTRIGIGIAAIALAIAAGTGAYAMRGDDASSDPGATASRDDKRTANPEAEGATMAMCVAGVPDCGDMVVVDGGGSDATADCPPDSACIEPWLMNPPVCADGLTLDECFPDGVSPGWDCAQLESFPVQTVCKWAGGCWSPIAPIVILPEPGPGTGDDPVTTDPATTLEVEDKPANEPAAPPIDCEAPPVCEDTGDDLGSDRAMSSVRCLPPECAVSSDGSFACPEPAPCVVTTDPMAGIAENECYPVPLPPECTQYEDGSVSCEGSAIPCDSDAGCGEGGCVGGPAVDCAPIDLPLPCVPGPATECGIVEPQPGLVDPPIALPEQ